MNERLLQALARQPGVASVGLVNNVPLSGNDGKSAAAVKGTRAAARGVPARALFVRHRWGLLHGDGIFLAEGRFLSADDSRRAERVCVVDEDFAGTTGRGEVRWDSGCSLGQMWGAMPNPSASWAWWAQSNRRGLTDQAAQGAVYYPYAMRDGRSVVFGSAG